MFGTFSSVSTGQEPATSSSAGTRPKRHQVARACQWCRTYRIKCDAKYPCRNCEIKGRICTTDHGKNEVRTFSSAIKQIDQLQERVKALENELKRFHMGPNASSQPKFGDGEPKIKIEQDTLPEELDPLAQHGANRNYYNWSLALREIKPGSNQAYGSSSMFYFSQRLNSYLNAVLATSPTSSSSVSTQSALSTPRPSNTFTDRNFTPVVPHNEQRDFSKGEEDTLLGLYWEHIHPLHPILEKDEFDAQYKELWKLSRGSRYPSALVDIILALCLQIDATFKASCPRSSDIPSNASIDSAAGQWVYRRCQYFLQDHLEEPSIVVFQCYYLSVLWLSRASLCNAAHSALATGLRIGVILGLHNECCPTLPSSAREFRKRLWWTMYSLDAQFAMDFGRPLAVHFSQVTCTLPGEDVSHENRSTNPHMAFNAQVIRLVLATRSIYILFYRECARILRERNQIDLHQDDAGLEECAIWLNKKTRYLCAWLRQVPDDLKVAREHSGQPYSTDRSRLLDLSALARSRLLLSIYLELLYHASAMSVYRPFLTFPGNVSDQCSATQHHASSCVKHATAIIDIIHQLLEENVSLSSLPEICSLAYNATLSLFGYMVAYPGGPHACTTNQVIKVAFKCFNMLVRTFATAKSALVVLQDFQSKVNLVTRSVNHTELFSSKEINVTGLPTSGGGVDSMSRAHGLEVFRIDGGGAMPGFYSHGLNGTEDILTSEEWLNSLLNFDSYAGD